MSVTFTTDEHYAKPTLASLSRPIIGEDGFNARSGIGAAVINQQIEFTPNLALPTGMTARLAAVYLGVAVPTEGDPADLVSVGSASGDSDASLSWWGYPVGIELRRSRRLYAVTVRASFSIPLPQSHVFVTSSVRVFAARAVFTASSA